MAVCSVEGGLQPTNFYAAGFAGQMGYHDFEGVTVRPEEGERLLANLGDKRVLMLRNHGPVVMGETLARCCTCNGPCSAPARCSWRPMRWANRS